MAKQTEEIKTPTYGEQVAAAIMPFAFSQHTLTRGEWVDMVAKPIDRDMERLNSQLAKRDALLKIAQDYMNGQRVILNGLSYTAKSNPATFKFYFGLEIAKL